jgi:hypothetical protein
VTHEQTSLFGDVSAADVGLGPVQRACMQWLRERDTISSDEAGAVAHSMRGKHPPDELCRYCGVDGPPILRSLLRRGLIERATECAFQLKGEKPLPDHQDIPY